MYNKHFRKLTIMGDMLKIEFNRFGVVSGFEGAGGQGSKKTDLDLNEREKLDIANKKRVIRKRLNTFKELVNCNFFSANNDTRFWTITFRTTEESKDFTTDYEYCEKQLNKFFKRLDRYLEKEKIEGFKILGTKEQQKNGSWHYHCLVNKFIKQNDLRDLWLKNNSYGGSINVKGCKNINNVGNYLTKYLSKTFDNPFLQNKKAYICRGAMLKPLIYTDSDKDFDYILERFSDVMTDDYLDKTYEYKYEENGILKNEFLTKFYNTTELFKQDKKRLFDKDTGKWKQKKDLFDE